MKAAIHKHPYMEPHRPNQDHSPQKTTSLGGLQGNVDEREAHLSHNQNPVLKWSTQNHASSIKKAELRSYLWQGDCPLLTLITYPGFEHVTRCGSQPMEPFGPGEIATHFRTGSSWDCPLLTGPSTRIGFEHVTQIVTGPPGQLHHGRDGLQRLGEVVPIHPTGHSLEGGTV